MELWQEFELLCKGIIHIETVCKEWKVLGHVYFMFSDKGCIVYFVFLIFMFILCFLFAEV